MSTPPAASESTSVAGAATTLVPEPVVTPPPSRKSGVKKPTGRIGTNINSATIQEAVLNVCCDFMGSDLWLFTKGSRRRYKWRNQLLEQVREVAGFNLCYETLMRWISYYQKYGEAPARARNRKYSIRGLRTSKEGEFKKRKHRKILKEIIDNEPQLYLDEIQKKLFEQTGKLWSCSTIWKQLHTIGYSLKVAVLRAKQQDEEQLAIFQRTVKDRVQHPRQYLFIDETARGANASRRRRAWGPRGTSTIIDAAMVRDFDTRYSLIAACNWEGFVPKACKIVEREYSTDDKDPDRGTVDAERFEEYLEEKVRPILGNASRAEPNSIVIMDNASIHNALRVRDIIEGAGALLIYTAPYSPEYNPIESMFGEHKKSLKRHSYDGTKSWIRVHNIALASVTPDMAKSFFRNSQVPLMEWWFEQQALVPEKNSDFLPFPCNEVFEAPWDIMWA